MRHRSLRTRLVVSLVLVAAGALLLAGVLSVFLVRRGEERATVADATHKADNISSNLDSLRQQLEGVPGSGTAPRLRDALDQLRSSVRVSDARVVFITPNGDIATLDELPPLLANALRAGDPNVGQLLVLPEDLTREQVRTDALLAGERVVVRRPNSVFVATPIGTIRRRGTFTAAVVIGEPVDHDAARRAAFAVLLAGGVALLLSFAAATWLARRLTRPLADIEQTARAVAAGDLDARVSVDRSTDAELAAVAAALNRMAADLADARHAERTFLQAVSHDLRTPLTSIRGYAEALADGTLDASDDDARRRAAAVIATESRRLERLVRDLLDLSRLDAHEFTLRPRPCDAATVVRETAVGFAPRATELGLAFEVAAPDPIPADLDAERLGQIVANLTENALKYARSRVDVRVDHTDRSVTVRVRDDGPGIPVDEQARVFERLYLARNGNGRAIGNGLGLAIVRELARAMGGDVRLERSDPTGSEFSATVGL
jgi:two-component system sensor histidine kinase BaeS